MYTALTAPLDALVAEGLTPRAVDILRNFAGQCMSALQHRGPVSILGSRPAGATDAMLTVANYPIPPEDQYTPSPSNGCAVDTEGALCLTGPFKGGFMWAKATGNHSLGSTGPSWDSTVACSIATGASGTLASPTRNITVYLPRTQTQDPNVRTNDVIQVKYDTSGVAYIDQETLDGKVGDFKIIYVADPTSPLDYTTAAGVRGWRVADGTNGTQDMSGRQFVGWTSGGSATGTAVGAGITWSGADISGSGTLTVAHNASGGGSTISSDGTTVTINTDTPAQTTGASTSTTYVTGFTNPHSHTITKANIVSAIADWSVAYSSIASGLSIEAPATVTTLSRIELILQRIS